MGSTVHLKTNQVSGGGSGLPPATSEGQVLYSEDGATFTAEQPLTSQDGWLVNDQGILIIV